MKIVEVANGLIKKAEISLINGDDLKLLTRQRYSFDWKMIKDEAALYKLHISGEEDILGAMALIDFPNESRIEIKLLACSNENIGRNKRYDRIAGCLIAFAGRLAIDRYKKQAGLSLQPKTVLILHYMEKYDLRHAGHQLFIDGIRLENLVKKYLL